MLHLFRAALCCVSLFSVNTLQAACNTNAPGSNENRFTINSNGTATDNRTGLIWMRCDLGANWDASANKCVLNDGAKKTKDSWGKILESVSTFNSSGGFAGASDWRLPNLKEMASIMLLHCDPPLDPQVFPDVAGQYWTSTPTRAIQEYSASKDSAAIYESSAWSMKATGSTDVAHAIVTAWSTPLNAKLVRNTSSR